MRKHTILFLAANPLETDRLALDREAREIQLELALSGRRDQFEFVTRWAAEPLDLLRELRKLKPTVVHFSGHGIGRGYSELDKQSGDITHRDIRHEPEIVARDMHQGLFFQGPDGRAQFVSSAALQETFEAAGASVKLVVLNACYSEFQADSLAVHVGCVIGMRGSISDDAAKKFAIGFYGGLGENQSVTLAYKQGCAAIRLENLSGSDRPQLKIRNGLDAAKLVLTSATSEESAEKIWGGELKFVSIALDSLVVNSDMPRFECHADPVFDVTLLNMTSSPVVVSAVGVKIMRVAQTTCLYGAPRATKILRDDAHTLVLPDICRRLDNGEICESSSPKGIGEAVYIRLPDPMYLEPGAPYRYSLLLKRYKINMPTWTELVIYVASDRGECHSIAMELINA